jgi:hypothetical protein
VRLVACPSGQAGFVGKITFEMASSINPGMRINLMLLISDLFGACELLF